MGTVAVPALFIATLTTGVAAAQQPTVSAQVAQTVPASSAQAGSVSSGSISSGSVPSVATASAAQAQAVAMASRPRVSGYRHARVSLNVRTQPRLSSRVVAVLKPGQRVAVTGATSRGWTRVVFRDRGRWVSTRYLAARKPATQRVARTQAVRTQSAGATSRLSMKPCRSGSRMERGLKRDAIRVHRAICAKFPQIRSYGGKRASSGHHGTGRAVDVMIPNNRVGWQIARWVRANRKALGVSEVIFARKIWTVQRSSEGWRGMSNRGSKSANHYDHVHVSVYGNRGTS